MSRDEQQNPRHVAPQSVPPGDAGLNLPTGTVTFLFTDIEGSTRLWEEQPDTMELVLQRHDVLLRAAIETNNGVVFKTVGDSFCAAFTTASSALEAALTAQQSLHDVVAGVGSRLTLKVRMAVHSGTAQQRDSDYFGATLNRAARLLAIGHGGQVLLSEVAQELCRDSLPSSSALKSLGRHRLRDLHRPENVFQLLHPGLPSEFAPLKSLDNPELPNNLQLQLTSFIGREKEMAGVKALLKKARLVTLTGSGGSGKTRLSLQVAADVLDQYPEGIWQIELAPLVEPALVAQTVASTLGIREQKGRTLAQTLIESLKTRRMLLLLDNCEHLLKPCAQLSSALLGSCPHLKILATSRETLGVAGEFTYRVPTLSYPDPRQTLTPHTLSQYEAVRLFLERAAQHKADFAVIDSNASALAQLCSRLDGIPFALELAAARIGSLSVEDINSRLDNRFRLLKGGSRTALPRHQTLQALIDWSYDLLTEQEKILLVRLSVFADGWTLEAAVSVCGGGDIPDWEVIDLLTSLVDKSLVLAEEKSGLLRYRMLETVRAYAIEKLKAGREEAEVRSRHLDWYLALSEEAAPELGGSEQGAWLERLEREHDNLRAALSWSQAQEETADSCLQMCGALQQFWRTRGHLEEGRRWCEIALAHPGTTKRTVIRANTLNGAGGLAFYQGDYVSARASYEQGLAIYREMGNQRGVASSLIGLGGVASSRGDYVSARASYEQSLAIHREMGNQRGVANSLIGLGGVAYSQGDYASAKDYFEQSLAICRQIGDLRDTAYSLNNLGNVASSQNDYTSAKDCFEQSLAIQQEIGNRQGIAHALINLGNLAFYQGDYASAQDYFEQSLRIYWEIGDQKTIAYALVAFANLASTVIATNEVPTATVFPAENKTTGLYRAARLWGAAQALRDRIGAPLLPAEQEEQEREAATARAKLGEANWTTAWEEGQAMSLNTAIVYALEKTAPY